MKPSLSVVIPVGPGDSPEPALRSLDYPAEIIVSHDPEGNGANWARNRGARLVRSSIVLFCDADVVWHEDGILEMVWALVRHPEAAYSYGAYEMDGKVHCAHEFDGDRLRRNNFISTMSVIRTADFPGWDEEIERLQDWDLWLSMLAGGKGGVYCGRTVFSTQRRPGITYGDGIGWEEARAIVARKHGLK